jgi:hypothetical protein
MKFKVFTKIEMHNKIIVSKLDFLSKYVGRRMAITIIPNVVTMNTCNICLLFKKHVTIHPSKKVIVLVRRLLNVCVMLC